MAFSRFDDQFAVAAASSCLDIPVRGLRTLTVERRWLNSWPTAWEVSRFCGMYFFERKEVPLEFSARFSPLQCRRRTLFSYPTSFRLLRRASPESVSAYHVNSHVFLLNGGWHLCSQIVLPTSHVLLILLNFCRHVLREAWTTAPLRHYQKQKLWCMPFCFYIRLNE